MTNIDRNLPEPRFPEHALIRDAAPNPRLSAGFRDRVLTECQATVRITRREFRQRVTLSAAAVCCLALLMLLGFPSSPQSVVESPPPAEEHDSSPTESHSLGNSQLESQRPRLSGSGLAADKVRPDPKSELQQMDELMEGLQNRTQQLLDANMFPQF